MGANREIRLRALEIRICDGEAATSAVAAIAEEFAISPRQTWRDLGVVYTRWQAEESKNRGVRRQRRVRWLESIARKAENAGDYKTAIRAISESARIEGDADPSARYSIFDEPGIQSTPVTGPYVRHSTAIEGEDDQDAAFEVLPELANL